MTETTFGYTLVCPRCGNKDHFSEHESGPDSYDDDISYTSYSCNQCNLWYSDWTKKWYKNITNWRDEESENEYEVKAS